MLVEAVVMAMVEAMPETVKLSQSRYVHDDAVRIKANRPEVLATAVSGVPSIFRYDSRCF